MYGIVATIPVIETAAREPPLVQLAQVARAPARRIEADRRDHREQGAEDEDLERVHGKGA